jgi:amidase
MTTAFAHCPTETPITVNGEAKDYWHNNTYCQLFNLTGHPAVILPYTRDADGLPIGIQVVGRRWDDERLLAIAGALVEVTGSFERPPGY